MTAEQVARNAVLRELANAVGHCLATEQDPRRIEQVRVSLRGAETELQALQTEIEQAVQVASHKRLIRMAQREEIAFWRPRVVR